MNKEAFADFRKVLEEVKNPPKNKEANTGKFKYRYSDLSDVLATIKPVLLKNNFILYQSLRWDGSTFGIHTSLIHETGETIPSFVPLNYNVPPQTLGAEITYMRRYALCALLNIIGDDDTDAQHLEKPVSAPRVHVEAPSVQAGTKPDPCNCGKELRFSNKNGGAWYCPNFQDKSQKHSYIAQSAAKPTPPKEDYPPAWDEADVP